jgi:hypothetical protein
MNDRMNSMVNDEPIRTEFVEASGLRFEVDMCGRGDILADEPVPYVEWQMHLVASSD